MAKATYTCLHVLRVSECLVASALALSLSAGREDMM